MRFKAGAILVTALFATACASDQTERLKESMPSRAEQIAATGNEKLQSGDVGRAEGRYKLALAMFQKKDDRFNAAKIYHRLGTVALIRQDLETARRYVASAGVIAGKEGYSELLFDIAISEASILIAEGRPQDAEDVLRRAAGWIKDSSSAKGGKLANAFGRVAMARSDLKPARKHFEEALKIARGNGDLSTESAALGNLGTLFIKLNQPDSAISLLKEGLEIEKNAGASISIGSTLHLLGKAYEAKGDRENALYFYNNALNLNRQVDLPGRAESDKNAIHRVELNLK